MKTKLSCALATLVLCISIPALALAAGLEAHITETGITHNSAELFGFDDVLPGDTFETELTVVNDTDNSQSVNFYLDHKPTAEATEFASVCQIKIYTPEKLIFAGTLEQVASDDLGLHIFNIEPAVAEEINFELYLPDWAHEPHAGTLSEFDWSIHSETVIPNSPTTSDKTFSGTFDKTGIDTALLYIAIALLILGSASLIILSRKRKE